MDLCDKESYIDPPLSDWRTVLVAGEELKKLTRPVVYKTDTQSIISCFTEKIVVNGTLRMCPQFVFSLPLQIPFQLPGLSHNVTEFT